MIIVVRDFPGFSESPDKIRALTNILTCCGEGKHVLWMPSDKAEELINSGHFINYPLRVLHHIKGQSRFTKGLTEKLRPYLEIDFETTNTFEHAGEGKMVIGYRKVIDTESLQSSKFLVENLSDSDFYKLGANSLLYREKLSSEYSIKLRSENGGGNTTFSVFERITEAQELVLCILDSDKEHPNGPLGDTASRFNQVDKGYGPGYQLEVLTCTEAENLVPFSVAKEVIATNKPECFDSFARVTPEFREYADHKTGLRQEAALRLDETHGVNHWGQLISSRPPRNGEICPSLGDRFLSHSIEHMQLLSTAKLCERIDPTLDAKLLTVSNHVVSWGIGLRNSIR
ncbi:hypothetical protein HKD51_00455 [Pseudomonas fragi]|jgi:hypothetical protein|nr:hypothetical protein [Pseudomonas sp. GC01]